MIDAIHRDIIKIVKTERISTYDIGRNAGHQQPWASKAISNRNKRLCNLELLLKSIGYRMNFQIKSRSEEKLDLDIPYRDINPNLTECILEELKSRIDEFEDIGGMSNLTGLCKSHLHCIRIYNQSITLTFLNKFLIALGLKFRYVLVKKGKKK